MIALEDTKLFSILNKKEDALSKRLTGNLILICKNAADRMKSIKELFSQYTLHDETHLLNVVNLMGQIIPDVTLNSLSSIEIYILVLLAFLHDQGMVFDAEEYDKMKNSSEFKISFSYFKINNKNYQELTKRLEKASGVQREALIIKKTELDYGHFIDYIRRNHGNRAEEYIVKNFSNDSSFKIDSINIAPIVGKLCRSHVEPAFELNPVNEFYYDKLIGSHSVNMVYLGLILRLSDILDFSRDRTPDILFKTIKFNNEISILEWYKNMSVTGWSVKDDDIFFQCECDYPEYQKAIYEYLEWINYELVECNKIIRNFPRGTEKYSLHLPLKVRDLVKPRNDSYIYRNLSIQLSKDDILRLFVTDDLYQKPWICVRELLQNSLDALRFRQALYQRDEIVFAQGKVELRHYIDEFSKEILECKDNGIGMDESIIEKYLLNVGRSYYNSPEFDLLNESFKDKGIKFSHIAQFGIGFLSCFAFGNEIRILTRKDNGIGNKHGNPLIVEINGLTGIITIRKGKDNQEIGTTVQVKAEKQPFYDIYYDKIRLINTLDGIALNCDFPIMAQCEIPDIEDKLEIKNEISIPETEIEKIEDIKTIIKDFNLIHDDLKGSIKMSFLSDSEGKITINNGKYTFLPLEPSNIVKIDNIKGKVEKLGNAYRSTKRICFDGIYVIGMPSRTRDPMFGHTFLNDDLINCSYTLDVRGNLKGELTPNREKKETSRSMYDKYLPRWSYIFKCIDDAKNLIWDEILPEVSKADPSLPWKILFFQMFNPVNLRRKLIWEYLYIPFKEGEKFTWIPFKDVKELKISKNGDEWCFVNDEGKIAAFPDDVTQWTINKRHQNFDTLNPIILNMCTLDIQKDEPILKLQPTFLEKTNDEFHLHFRDFHFLRADCLTYHSSIVDLLSCDLKLWLNKKSYVTFNRNVNYYHPLIKNLQNTRFADELTESQEYNYHLVNVMSSESTFDILRNNRDTVTFEMKYVGNLFKHSSIDAELKPPYKIWIRDKGIVTINAENLETWAITKTGSERFCPS